MKKISLVIILMSLSFVLQAQAIVTSCEQAIEITNEYTGSFSSGEYWFTAMTSALPLTLNYYPDDENSDAPQVFLDLTCEYDSEGNGIYRDSLVRGMISLAENYDLSFPMRTTLKKQTDEDGRVFYSILFDRNYRDMLYEQGVTYAIPAYLKITVNGTATVNIVSTSINTKCRDYVNDLGMNTSLLIAPDDSLNVYRWQLGEWINLRYHITWTGNGKLDLYTGKDCQLTSNLRVRDHFVLPDQQIQMTPRLTKDWINDIYATEMYVRLYAGSEGLLTISEYNLETKLLSFVVADVNATIDYEKKIIYARLPRGALNNASRRKLYIQRAVVTYMLDGVKSTDPSGYAFDTNCTILKFDGQEYLLDIEFADQKGSTEATLSSIVIDGDTLHDFTPSTLYYNDVEVQTDAPIITPAATDTAASLNIKQATTVPGTASITVTAVAGNTLTYTLNLIKARSRNTLLSSITVDGEPLAGFTPDNHHYRMYAQSIPVVEAVAADEKSNVVVDQAKGVPGFAQIFVTAEAGNVDTYTINFSIDPRVLQCAEDAITMSLNTPISLQAGGEQTQVIRIPMGKPSLEADPTNWSGQRISLLWSGEKDVMVYVGTTCLFDPMQPDKTLLDSFLISMPKGEDKMIAYLTQQHTLALGKQSIDGYLYLRCKTQEAGLLAAQTWTPTCQNSSTLIDINDELFLPASHNSENVYKFYLPDWKGKKVKISWEGQDKMTMWTAHTCNFKLNSGDRNLVETMQYQASDEKEIDDQHVSGVPNGWIWKCTLGSSNKDFLYIRFWTDGYAGTLTTKQIGGPVDPTGADAVRREPTLGWERTETGVLISSTVSQHVQVYSLQGILLRDCQLTPAAPLTLPRGLYIIRGETETGLVVTGY